jgi:hypothetical protein
MGGDVPVANSQAKSDAGLQRDLFLSEGDADVHALREHIRAAVDEIGFKEVLFRLGDCDRTTLANKLACRDGRSPGDRLLLLLCQLQPSGNLLRFLCGASGYAPPERLVEEEPEEKLKRVLREVRAECGLAGDRAITRALGRAR